MPGDKDRLRRLQRIIVQYTIPIILLILFSILFYRQITRQGPEFRSDILAHIKAAKRGGGYSLLFYIIKLIISIKYGEVLLAVFEGFLTVFTIFPIRSLLQKQYSIGCIPSCFAAEILLFLCAPYIPVVYPFFYSGGIITQPWHNITYIGMRLFASLTILSFSRVIQDGRRQISLSDWLITALLLLITTGIKPNFLIAFSWTLLVFLIYDVCKARFQWDTFKQCIKLGTIVFPALLILYVQSKVLYGSQDNGIEFTILHSRFFSKGIWDVTIRLIRVFAYPSLVFYFSRERGISRIESFLFVQFLISLFISVFFQETGTRAGVGNFWWTAFVCGFVFFGVSTGRFFQYISLNRGEKKQIAVGVALLAWHIISGIAYFCIVCSGAYFVR